MRTSWNKGLTKEIDYRIFLQASKVSGSSHYGFIQSEDRECKCGCKKTFKCKIHSKKLYIKGHFWKGYKGRKIWNKGTKGLCKAWNKGLKKEADIRVYGMGRKNSLILKEKFLKGDWVSPSLLNEVKSKLSQARSRVIEEKGGGGGFGHIKWYAIKNILGEQFYARGRWEVKIANELNSRNILWKRRIYLKYTDNEVIRTYTPDFYLPDYNWYIEVKGYFPEEAKKKLQLVISQNKINLFILQENPYESFEKLNKFLTGIEMFPLPASA